MWPAGGLGSSQRVASVNLAPCLLLSRHFHKLLSQLCSGSTAPGPLECAKAEKEKKKKKPALLFLVSLMVRSFRFSIKWERFNCVRSPGHNLPENTAIWSKTSFSEGSLKFNNISQRQQGPESTQSENEPVGAFANGRALVYLCAILDHQRRHWTRSPKFQSQP